jgi:hypothetical protein
MSSSTDQWAWVRHEIAGVPANSGDNLADFVLVSTTGESVGGVPSAYGSPSPTGTVDPFQQNGVLTSSRLDEGASVSDPANREYVPGVGGAPGTLTIRRTITNNAASDYHYKAQVRVTSLSEVNGAPFPGISPPANPANLRVVDPSTSTSAVSTTGGVKVVQNLSLAAPNVGINGGLNSTLLLPEQLGPGASVNIAITFLVDSKGYFWFGYDMDSLVNDS